SVRCVGLPIMPPMEAGSPEVRRWTLIAVCVTTFMLLLDITIVNVALPSIQHRLKADLTGLQWVVDAYALALAALILTAGALADRFGRRLLFTFGVVVFSSASLLCGLAWNITVLDVARGLQGIGGAALFRVVVGLLRGDGEGWGSGLLLSAVVAGVVLLAVFVLVEARQERPMLDISLFRRPAFLGVSLATFAIGAGMFALFPYLSI